MAFEGFGSASGPTVPPKSQTPFGYFTRPPSPSPSQPSPPPLPYVPPQRSPFRNVEAQERMLSPPLAFQNSRSVVDLPYRPSVSSPRWGGRQKALLENNNAQTLQRPSVITPFSASRNVGTSIQAKIPQFQDLKRTRSPPVLSSNGDKFRNISHDVSGSRLDSDNDWNNLGPQRTRSPLLGNNDTVKDLRPPFSLSQGPVVSSPAWVNKPRLQVNYSDLLTSQEPSPVTPSVDPYESQRNYPTEHADVQFSKRTRSPPLSSANEVNKESSHLARNVIKRTSISPPTSVTRSNLLFHTPGSEFRQRFSPSIPNGVAEVAVTKPTSVPTPKRTRSPPLPSADQVFQGGSHSTKDETEREMQAKAKRLARFRVELSQPSSSDIANNKSSGNRHDHPMAERQKSGSEHSMEAVGDFPNGSALPDNEGLKSSSIITGFCPDMCPEPERAERERKGDLDQYERLDGDRNQTSKSLAVKKYNRTAEREADLIRPMPILQKTIDYLLNLLDQPYDDRFLGMYNFLWDRMRAIRMDLRMQHIFNLGAITMLEQMIRLHILAMHELCEYTKGEGFSEGFDAHLNIEQMNKTSVELFQMYDDHRKKGINVPTEKEFRGYYALLKLDKHPGYKVEPAELSLDLAKMTPEIRQTPEVLFARDVARACRTGNFIAFFRLARRASYLQACLMHAHFAKLRTQALASLHSALQNNQGLPVSNVAKWLGMEEEDIESLLDYHGFLIKEFEEPYMVKEGSFLNDDKDYPTKCSKLVHLKRSRMISGDVSSSRKVVFLPAEEKKKLQLGKVQKRDPPAVKIAEAASPTLVLDEDMPDSQAISFPKDVMQVQPVLPTSIFSHQSGDVHQVASVSFSTQDFFQVPRSPKYQPAKVGRVEKQNAEAFLGKSLDRNLHSETKAVPLPISPGRIMPELSPASKFDFAIENSVPQNVVIKDLEGGSFADIHQEIEPDKALEQYHQEEASEAKLKLILRIWRRRSSKLKELREQRLLSANAALNSLSLGPPILKKRNDPSTYGEFNIDHVMRERYEKRERSWSRLNVSDVVVDQLSKRNPEARCLCFKIILCSQMNNSDGYNQAYRSEPGHIAAGSWLLSKLMPARNDDDHDLALSIPGLSIWTKWLLGQSSTALTCCLSVIKDVRIGDINDSVLGASAILFLASENISWEIQKIKLQNLLLSVPCGSRLPLLILSDSFKEDITSATIIDRLGLYNFDKSRIIGVEVVFLARELQMEPLDEFFSDEQLKEGLQWLANESPLQPVLNKVKTRELVTTHLNSALEVLDEASVYEVAPYHCVSAFNEALDRSLSEVAEAASANSASWPCPEINLLEESSAEHRASSLYLPSIGWSSGATIEPLMCALRDCKLPAFSDDISWLGRGSSMGDDDIENQRAELKNCLIRYLSQSSKMMGLMLATNEASVMLQKNAGLELHQSSFYIIPKWVMIFRRIFNWRLTNLSSEDSSTTYIFERRSGVSTTLGGLDNLKHGIGVPSPYHLMHPSLDEMVEVCSPLLSRKGVSQPEARRYPSTMTLNLSESSKATDTTELMEEESNLRQDSELNISSEPVVDTTVKKEADELSKLLDNCNILQDMIDEKLSIYF